MREAPQMSQPYITLWSQPQVEIERRAGQAGGLRHTANDQFTDVGVEPGDRVYILATNHGQLLLLARLEVERVVGQAEAQRVLNTDNLYEAATTSLAPEHRSTSTTSFLSTWRAPLKGSPGSAYESIRTGTS
jgi:hypothetical protein